MSDNLKFPNGYDVTVLRRSDVIDCIDKNIVDKEIALAIIEQCETAAVNFLQEGRWTGIPFIGNIRVPKMKQLQQSKEYKSLVKEARDLLDKDDYIIFKKKLTLESSKRIKYNRYYKYITSIAVNKNRQLYRKLCKEKGDVYARIYMFSMENITATDNEYVILKDYE